MAPPSTRKQAYYLFIDPGRMKGWMSNIKLQSLNCIRLDTGSQWSRFLFIYLFI